MGLLFDMYILDAFYEVPYRLSILINVLIDTHQFTFHRLSFGGYSFTHYLPTIATVATPMPTTGHLSPTSCLTSLYLPTSTYKLI